MTRRKTTIRRAGLIVIALTSALMAGWFGAATDAAPPRQDATPTPTKPPVRVEITFPTGDDVVFGTIAVEGTALTQNYQHYQLHIAPSGSESWTWLTTDIRVVREGTLYTLDTTRFRDGFYDLRVRAVDQRGAYRESFVRGFEIRNANPPTPTPTLTPTPVPVPTDESGSPLETVSPLETPTVTPTPTIDTTSFVPGGQGIYSPVNGQELGSYVRIIGTANGRDIHHPFLRYELHVAPAGTEEWRWVVSSQEQHFNGTLHVLDTTTLPNGLYDLRLRIVYRDSNYDEYFVRNLAVNNDVEIIGGGRPLVRLDAPPSGATIHTTVDVIGTVYHPQMLRWELYWAEHTPAADDDRAWRFLFQGDYPVLNDLIARIDLSRTPPGVYDLRLRLVRQDGNYEDFHIQRLHVVQPTPTPQYPPAH